MGESGESSVNLDSFLDIMTCLVGVLVLIIILTGVDASQIKTLIPTPMGVPTDKRPVFLECRGDRLFEIDVETINEESSEKLREIARQVEGDTQRLMEELAATNLRVGSYDVDLTYALLAQFALKPAPGVEGYELGDIEQERPDTWLGRILDKLDREEEILTFLVRDDSFDVFRRARNLAWSQGVECTYELLDMRDPIKFGLGGSKLVAQ
jgi:hypothetical protein